MASQFRLLAQRRFAPFFGAQALGAFNDNLLRNSLVILGAYQGAALTNLEPGLLGNLAAGLFVLPYLLFSGIAGQLADRFDKTRLIRIVMAAEFAITGVAGFGFATAQIGLLPQVLRYEELVGDNALVEMGAFVAILLGTLAAGEFASAAVCCGGTGVPGTAVLVGAMLGVAVLGWVATLAMPRRPAVAPQLRIDWNPRRSGWANVRAARESRTVCLSILGISWFWDYGALVLAPLPL